MTADNVLRPEYPGHVWAYDFIEGRTHVGSKFRILTVIDEASRECLALIVARQLKHEDVLAVLAELSHRARSACQYQVR